MLDKIISYSFYLLFFLTPLFWTSLNHELFEYNKMILTYTFTVVIVGAWVLKIINHKSLIFNRTPLDIPLLLFLGANILSTIFSIDPHTSIWGYYSRSNGGLLSIISYLLLYWAFVSNMDFPKVKTALKFGLASGFLISLWAIFEHFGVSPSCVILRGEFNADCWIQRVQERVFATLGQPNWLAAYLTMLIFPALYFFLTAIKKFTLYTYYIILTTYYLAFTFTYSRGPTLGLIGGIIVFTILALNLRFHNLIELIKLIIDPFFPQLSSKIKITFKVTFIKPLLVIITSFLTINLLFGSALTSFRLVSKFAAPTRPQITLPAKPSTGTQLETGGTESGQIRLIVWQGALEIFKHYPIFGSGVETFAYSYYQYRPAAHNLTSEWDFLYNKAHNEYLNYLATTGIVGFGTYILVIGVFIYWCIVRIFNFKFLIFNLNSNFKFQISNFKTKESDLLLIISILASYVSYLVYNFFLFSVVTIAIFFYLFPAMAFVVAEATEPFKLPSNFYFLSSTFRTIYRRPSYTKFAKGVVIALTIYFLYSILKLWLADFYFARGEKASDAGNPGRAYNLLSTASQLNKGEPFYRSELGFAAAQAASALIETEASLSAALKEEAAYLTADVLNKSPKNVSFYRTAVRTYFELSTIDKSYVDKTLQTLDLAISLAPTDPKLYYNKALILDSEGRKEEEITILQEAIRLKPNYLEALAQLKEATESGKAK